MPSTASTTPHRAASSSTRTPAVVSLVPLKNSLCNLPGSLASSLVVSNTPAQNVLIEIIYEPPAPPGPDGKPGPKPAPKSIFCGWTGMQSKPRLGTTSKRSDPTLELDPSFALANHLSESTPISLLLHFNPPTAHTVHIEPLTPSDWEVIELHASFLEVNLLAQLRALSFNHPLVIYLTPSITAMVRLVRLEPEDAYLVSAVSGAGFARLGGEAEVVVAPKERVKKVAAPESVRSSSVKPKAREGGGVGKRREGVSGKGEYFRAVALPYRLSPGWEEEGDEELMEGGKGVTVYLDPEVAEAWGGCPYAVVQVVTPPGLAPPGDGGVVQGGEEEKGSVPPATRVVAKVAKWENAPDRRHVGVSRALVVALDLKEEVGTVVKLEPAPGQLPKGGSAKITIHPFLAEKGEKEATGLKWGGKVTAKLTKEKEQEAILGRLKEVLSAGARKKGEAGRPLGSSILDGPVTDGLVLPPIPDSPLAFGGVLTLEVPSDCKTQPAWLTPHDRKYQLILTTDVPKPGTLTGPFTPPPPPPKLAAIDKTLDSIRDGLLSGSSTLVTGSHLSGKTSVLNLITHEFSAAPHYYHILRPPPLLKLSDERIGALKEALTRWFLSARWHAGSRASILVLDDLDRVCGPETEGTDVARARQVAETVVNLCRRYVPEGSNIYLLASAVGKDSIHAWLTSSKIFRDVTPIPALDREARRRVLSSFADLKGDGKAQIPFDPEMDLLEVAGKTDGYTPGDLLSLLSRARHASLIRTLETPSVTPSLTQQDFSTALQGFLPTSLRSINLQSTGGDEQGKTSSWDAIGGLHETRQTLLETLSYPTLYAPIFAASPLRLRSGILLYGHPGCGKTLLASSLASHTNLNFISVKGPEILNKYIGASEASVRNLFERAQAAAPCILFFDEFDSIAPKRGHDSTGVTDRVVNQMLTQMDGAEGLTGVYVLAATSRPDLIDPALLRPGRLDKSLLCGMPDRSERKEILKAVVKSGGLHFADGEEDRILEEVASKCEGYSGADLNAVLYNAHLEAVHAVIEEGEERERRKGERGGKGKGRESEEGGVEFMEFPFDPRLREVEEEEQARTPAEIAERARLVDKLTSLRHRNASKMHPEEEHEGGKGGGEGEEEEDAKICITWEHIESSLKSTRPSISRQEREKLERVYEEFVGSRKGDLRSGEGGREVGGRASLM
ncbi:AAA-domain-containing protein [Ascobolus immersus RN42]|uniref:Peroxisomal ATPase PEX1 n=1 Tax=Ascobolus immersus RN42 TaxID=1160509 RepID=A0A3N4HQW2_ASCIM|nr:AAA-domain-containing protein [Ascobolus immersus RN42]